MHKLKIQKKNGVCSKYINSELKNPAVLQSINYANVLECKLTWRWKKKTPNKKKQQYFIWVRKNIHKFTNINIIQMDKRYDCAVGFGMRREKSGFGVMSRFQINYAKI